MKLSKVLEAIHKAPELSKLAGDGTAFGVLIATITGGLPSIAAATTIIWTTLRIYETVLNIRERKKK